jgi:predicted ATPase/DNA-binding CsgD family transcriptional regulator
MLVSLVYGYFSWYRSVVYVPVRFPEEYSMAESISQEYGNPRLIHLLGQDELAEAPTGALPAQHTSLVGRVQEVVAVCTLLRQSEVRLLTLTGAGGVGKTRLGLQAAAEVIEDFPDGVCFVPLAPLSDTEFVVPTIAQALGLWEAEGQLLSNILKIYLQNKRLLLVLDNFEQVVGSALSVMDLLDACPQLKVLVTSRIVLHVRAEREFPVRPLSLPDPQHLPDLAALSQYEAVALFIQRAQAIQPDFQVTSTNAPAVAEICARLDGLPLAIELAAARIKVLPPEALLTRLGRRLPVLTSVARDVPARQQTLRNTIAWSYHLLDPQEQHLFRRLSVFTGNCSLTAVEALYPEPGDEEVPILDRLASLLDKSLLQRIEQEGGELYLRILETIREYGLEVLAASGEMESTQHAHAIYYLRVAEVAEGELEGPQQIAWLERLERDYDNIRAAMRWSLDRAKAEEAADSIENEGGLALRFGGAMQRFWIIRGHVTEGRTYMEEALARSSETAGPVRAKALKAAARLALVQGDYQRGEVLCEESLALYRELGNTAGEAFSIYLLGIVAWRKGHSASARELSEKALALSRAVNDRELIASSLYQSAYMAGHQGAYTRARDLFAENLALNRELGNKRGIVQTLFSLAQVLLDSQIDQETLPELLEEGIVLSKELGFKEGISTWMSLSAQVALSSGDALEARSLLEESLVLSKEIGHRHGTASALALLARVAVRQGELVTARTLYEESLTITREIGDTSNTASCLEELAGVAVAQQNPVWAARLLGAAEVLRDTLGTPVPPVERPLYERSVANTRAQLGEKAYVQALIEGRSMTPEQAVAAQGLETLSTASATKQLPPAATRPLPHFPDGLTAREVDVLRLLAQGMTDAQIAEQLVISPRTVNNHLTSIYQKIQVSSRSAATRYAVDHRLV